MKHSRPHIAFAATIPGTFRAFMVPHLRALAESHDITIFSNFKSEDFSGLQEQLANLPIRYEHVDFARKIDLFSDIRSWWQLFQHLRRTKYASLHSMMPKTGLVGMTAAFAAGVPVRIHMFTGQVWTTQHGGRRWLLKTLDRLTAFAATHIFTDSPSQRQFLIDNGFSTRIKVLGPGSVCGVNMIRFQPDAAARARVRSLYGISESDLVFGFLGRLNRDKGVADLLAAFESADLPESCHLMLVGPDEEHIGQKLEEIAAPVEAQIHFCGHTHEPESYLVAFDIFCLPSYREGFGTSVIEAAACGVPALVSNIYGLSDAVVDGVTGLSHPAGDVAAIAGRLNVLAADTDLRRQLGEGARYRVKTQFSEEILVAEMRNFYRNLSM